jgi:heptaprenyl diphosphate synthase
MSTSSIGMQVGDDGLERDLLAQLAVVEEQLAVVSRSEHAFITGAAQHVMKAGGKRFRPMLVLLAAHYGDPTASGVVPSALAVELTHLATLYHDDVMDSAEVRRGVPSANAKWANSIAILVGDFLFARASSVVSDLGADAVRVQAATFARLVEGQIRETAGPEPGVDPYEHYLAVVADKTASLVSTSAYYGARFSGAPEGVVSRLAKFGERLGVAFQLSDDVIDVTSDSADTGKTPGTDLREGVPTLPVLLAQAKDDAAGRRLRELLREDLTDDRRHGEALELLRADASMAEARAEVSRWSQSARELLSGLPPGPPTDALYALCDLVVSRTG